MEPVEVAEAAPVREERVREERVREERPREDRSRDERPREERPRRDRREDRRDDQRVVGMGDHVPEFILRSFRLKAEMPPEDEHEEVGEAPDVEEMPETVDAGQDE